MEWTIDRILAVVGIGAGIVGVIVALGVGIGMDTRTPGELRFVQGCFLFSALALLIPLVFWGVHSDSFVLKRWVVVAAVSALIAVCFVEGLRWANGRYTRAQQGNESAPKGVDSANANKPHLQVSLILDTVSLKAIAWHLQLENIGSVQLDDIRFDYKTEKFQLTGADHPIFVRTLPPSGKMTIEGVPFGVFDYKKTSYFVFVIHYQVEVNGDKKSFTTVHGFFVTPAKPTTVLPSSWSEQEGEHPMIPPPNTDIPVGSLVFDFDENKQATTRIDIFRDERKLLQCDLPSRIVTYTLIMNDGRELHFARPLPLLDNSDSFPGVHQIVITWDNNKNYGLLGVDGVSEEKTLSKPR